MFLSETVIDTRDFERFMTSVTIITFLVWVASESESRMPRKEGEKCEKRHCENTSNLSNARKKKTKAMRKLLGAPPATNHTRKRLFITFWTIKISEKISNNKYQSQAINVKYPRPVTAFNSIRNCGGKKKAGKKRMKKQVRIAES